jgi:phosphatidylserine/phosphatidylglycerophosphate/cardiolipin synthase-like enzyme
MNNDFTFFTNEPDRDLYSRFSNILKSNTQFFDILVGYFRTSGFYKMYPAMESVDKIRILVGLNVDKYTVKIIDRANEDIDYEGSTIKEGHEDIEKSIEKEFQESMDSSNVEIGVRTFIDWLKSGKLEMKMYTEAPVHAKVYIMRKDQEKVPDTYGSVITGSSNFSAAGLQNNLEFNVELKDSRDVVFALEHFEKLWDKGVDIKYLAEQTPGFSGADLEGLVREAALLVLQENNLKAFPIKKEHFEKILIKMKPSIDATSEKAYDEFKENALDFRPSYVG